MFRSYHGAAGGNELKQTGKMHQVSIFMLMQFDSFKLKVIQLKVKCIIDCSFYHNFFFFTHQEV